MTNGDGPLRCLIVDDSAAFRQAASKILEGGGMTVVGWAETTAQTLDQNERLLPDVVLLDIDLGVESGFDVAQALHGSTRHSPAVILVSTHSEQDFADLIRASPALGFLPKIAFSAHAVRMMLGESHHAGPAPSA